MEYIQKNPDGMMLHMVEEKNLKSRKLVQDFKKNKVKGNFIKKIYYQKLIFIKILNIKIILKLNQKDIIVLKKNEYMIFVIIII